MCWEGPACNGGMGGGGLNPEVKINSTQHESLVEQDIEQEHDSFNVIYALYLKPDNWREAQLFPLPQSYVVGISFLYLFSSQKGNY